MGRDTKAMKLISRPSPNFNERPAGVAVDMIVLHYTGMKTAEDALKRLCNPNPYQPYGRVSAHYTIDVNGDIYSHLHPRLRAWHAGVSRWAGRENINDYAIGIELVNKGHEHGYHDFPKAQIDALISLIQMLRQQYDISLENIVGHEDIAPDRKQDPGERFPWQSLVSEGVAHKDRLHRR